MPIKVRQFLETPNLPFFPKLWTSRPEEKKSSFWDWFCQIFSQKDNISPLLHSNVHKFPINQCMSAQLPDISHPFSNRFHVLLSLSHFLPFFLSFFLSFFLLFFTSHFQPLFLSLFLPFPFPLYLNTPNIGKRRIFPEFKPSKSGKTGIPLLF